MNLNPLSDGSLRYTIHITLRLPTAGENLSRPATRHKPLSSYLEQQLRSVPPPPRTIHRLLIKPMTPGVDNEGRNRRPKKPRQKPPNIRQIRHDSKLCLGSLVNKTSTMATRLFPRRYGASAYTFTSINRVWMPLHPDWRSIDSKRCQTESADAASIDDARVRAFEHLRILHDG